MRIEAIDADGDDLVCQSISFSAWTTLVARDFLVGRRDGVFQIEADDVGRARGGFFEEAGREPGRNNFER